MNKKFLLNIMMILSLVLAISCKSNSSPEGEGNGNTTTTPPATSKPEVDVKLKDSNPADKKTTDLEIGLTSSAVTEAKDIVFDGADKDNVTYTLAVKGVVLAGTDLSDSGNFESLADKLIDLQAGIKFKDSSSKKITLDDNKRTAIYDALKSANKFGMAIVTITATPNKGTDKAKKEITVYVKIKRND